MESSETSGSIFHTIIQSCGHEMRVIRLISHIMNIRGPCDHCWRVIREEKERAEQNRIIQR